MTITSGEKGASQRDERGPAQAGHGLTPAPPKPPESAQDAAHRLGNDASPSDVPHTPAPALELRGVVKTYGGEPAVAGIDLTVPTGSFYGLVGPNGAGKTTTLSMISGLLRPDRGEIAVFGADVRADPRAAKRLMGVLPDRLRTFDRLTGRQLLHYVGSLRGLKTTTIRERSDELDDAFDLGPALGRAVSDCSTGMTKKLLLACAMLHAPRLLVLDEPFESVDPVSSQKVLDVLQTYVDGGGTVVLSGHSMALIETMCSRISVLVTGQVLAEGTVDEVRGEMTLEQRFIDLSGGGDEGGALEWLHTSSS
ncbi:ABC transporter ATP-binding protein [Microbacterium sp. G2-8]|uniref:ABC transporter ATP-binding protein n=1 Tax=Microbacterium sp. G2-8 TaxID=2842454 RepID=UPI001C890F24|nr:ABC transporter ATP-binding protein [Microbacterium sp. G2-8]